MAILTEQGNRPAPETAAQPMPGGGARRELLKHFRAFARRYPLLTLFVLMVASNVAGTAFNIFYNFEVIASESMNDAQRQTFKVAIPIYNTMAWPLCMGAIVYLFWPLRRCLKRIHAGEAIEPAFMEFCRRRVMNLPRRALWVNAWGWLPGMVYFPLVVCVVGGPGNWATIWLQFPVSFIISALITVAQTFFITELFLIAFLYPVFFRDSRPELVGGVAQIPYQQRLIGLWLAIACMPLFALFVALWDQENSKLTLALFAAVVGSSFGIFGLVGRDLLWWVNDHAAAMAEISRGNFDVRIAGQRPDEWGRLTNHFNDMAAALGRARQLRETFGQFSSPEVLDEIIERMPGLEVTVQEITVIFADIRGFTRRTAGEPPERVGLLVNRFLTLALRSVEEKGGLVNKFLGDGFMALFGATRPRDDHADLALASAQNLMLRLHGLNEELVHAGEAPLEVGVGIHTGPALVGCFGGTRWKPRTGTSLMRRRVHPPSAKAGGKLLPASRTIDRRRAADRSCSAKTRGCARLRERLPCLWNLPRTRNRCLAVPPTRWWSTGLVRSVKTNI